MLQTFSAPQSDLYEERGQGLDLGYFVGIFNKRIFHFAIPFVLVLITGLLVVAIQRPIYRAEGKILVESPQIPTDLVEPTVTAAATERIQVIQQRLMSRDSLAPIIDKFGLFSSQRQYMTDGQILDLMRERSHIALIDLNTQIGGNPGLMQAKNSAIAFTVSFDYEKPDLATKVANQFLTAILDEDVRARTNRATETTEFLAQEVKRLQGKLDAINGQIFQIKQQAADPAHASETVSDPLKLKISELTELQGQLVAQTSVHSEEWPAVKSLKKRIAALQSEISNAPKTDQARPPADKDIDALQQQQTAIETDLDTTSRKLTAARLGESMERNQQSEHLQVLEQPITPQKHEKPNRPKLFALSFAAAAAAGLGMVLLAEMLDKTLRGSRELAGVVDSDLLVIIPYVSTAQEAARKRRRIILLLASLGVFLVTGLVLAFYIGIEISLPSFDRSWIDSLTRPSK
jgi:uncharacterized protein involved in exopolysaccharide biosynthesis